VDFVQFYLENAPDYKGRMLKEIWEWSDERLELGHDFIHVLFPSVEPSQSITNAPTLDAATLAALRGNKTIKKNLLKSFRLMLRYFGFRLAKEIEINIQQRNNGNDQRKDYPGSCTHKKQKHSAQGANNE